MTAPDRLRAALADRYTIERELGEGGMATVYLADDLKHDRKVAIKVLRPELAAVVGAERFLAEICTTANLRHPHILPLFDSGEADGFLWYAMPYVEGETLRARLDRERQLPVEEAVAIARKVAGALQAAHDAGVIHRDIKPANILLEKGEPVVADFGIALAVSEAGGGRLTETGLSLGTPYYMSPEQATADRDPDARSDVYALGAVVYEMLTGEPPFTGGSAQAIVGRILTSDPAPPTETRRSIPPNVEGAVLTALEKTPADRFQSAAGFGEALGDPTYARHSLATASGRGSRPWLAQPASWVTLAALAVAVGAAILRPGSVEAPASDSELVTRFPLDLGFGATEESFAISDDGSTIAWFSQARDGVHVRRLSEVGSRIVPGTEDVRRGRERGGSLAVSPDGSRVAYTEGIPDDYVRIFVAAVDGGRIIQVADSVEVRRWPSPIYWGDDEWIYFNAHDGGFRRVAASGAEEEVLLAGGPLDELPPAFYRPILIPGGRGAIVEVDDPDTGGRTITVIDLRSGERRSYPDIPSPSHYVQRTSTLIMRNYEGAFAAPLDTVTLQIGTPALIPDVDVRHVTGEGTAIESLLPSGARAGGLVLMSFDGRVTPLPNVPAQTWVRAGPVSPDGSHLLLDAEVPDGETGDWRTSVYAYALPAGPAVELGPANTSIGWSPDGRWAYALTRNSDSEGPDATGQWSIVRLAADGSGRREAVLGPLPMGSRSFGWGDVGPQGELAWVETMGSDSSSIGGSVIRVLRPSGDTASFGRAEDSNSGPAFSPDGRWLAYQARSERGLATWVQRVDGSEDPIRVSVSPGSAPVWSWDGGDIFYHECDPSCRRPVVRSFDNGLLGPPRSIDQAPIRAVLPGDSLYVTEPERQLYVVRNWDVEFERMLNEGGEP